MPVVSVARATVFAPIVVTPELLMVTSPDRVVNVGILLALASKTWPAVPAACATVDEFDAYNMPFAVKVFSPVPPRATLNVPLVIKPVSKVTFCSTRAFVSTVVPAICRAPSAILRCAAPAKMFVRDSVVSLASPRLNVVVPAAVLVSNELFRPMPAPVSMTEPVALPILVDAVPVVFILILPTAVNPPLSVVRPEPTLNVLLPVTDVAPFRLTAPVPVPNVPLPDIAKLPLV